MTDQQTITDSSDLRKYFHILPNMADDDLDPYAYRLLGHYKRICGENGGACTESLRKTAERCQMSKTKVSDARQDLMRLNWIDLEIIIKETVDGNTQIIGSKVTIKDRWQENVSRFTTCPQEGQGVSVVRTGCPSEGQGVRVVVTKKNIVDSSESEEQKREEPLISQTDSQFKIALDTTVWYIKDSRTDNDPIVIKGVVDRRTKKMVVIKTAEGQEFRVKEKSLRLRAPVRKTTPLQDVILEYSHGIQAGVIIGQWRKTTLNTLETRLLTASPGLTAQRLKEIYERREPKYWPKADHKIVDMVLRNKTNGHHPLGARDQSDLAHLSDLQDSEEDKEWLRQYKAQQIGATP